MLYYHWLGFFFLLFHYGFAEALVGSEALLSQSLSAGARSDLVRLLGWGEDDGGGVHFGGQKKWEDFFEILIDPIFGRVFILRKSFFL
jgi:hypothetical protein